MEDYFKSKCVICSAGMMHPQFNNSLLRLFLGNSIVCDKCGAVFIFIEGIGKWKLIKAGDRNNLIWQKYGRHSLSAQEWINIGSGGMSDAEERDAEIKSWMEKISSGVLKVKVIRAEVPVILHKDEETLCVLPNIFLYETRAVRVSRGGYGGASFRVAKGVSVHLGQFGAHSESHPEMRKIDQGTLVITNKRFVFSGAIKTVDCGLRKIVQIDPFDDAICLHNEDKEKTQYFTWTNLDSLERACKTGSEFLARREAKRISVAGLDTNGEIELNDQGRKVTIPLTGEILKSIIEAAIKNI